MRREPPRRALELAPIAFPVLMLVAFFVLPFGSMIAVSFFRRDPAAFYTPDFVLDNYARFASAFFGGALGFSIALAVAVAVLCIAIGFPFTWLLTRARRRVQVAWLVLLLSVLSLNEYIVAYMSVGFTMETLPIRIFNALRYGYTPTMAAVSVVFVALAALVFGAIALFGDLPRLLGAPRRSGGER